MGESVAQEAHRLVHGEKDADYGPPTQDFRRVGRLWGPLLGLDRDVTPREVGLCLAALKLARESFRPKRDTRVDLAGYAITLDMLDE